MSLNKCLRIFVREKIFFSKNVSDQIVIHKWSFDEWSCEKNPKNCHWAREFDDFIYYIALNEV